MSDFFVTTWITICFVGVSLAIVRLERENQRITRHVELARQREVELAMRRKIWRDLQDPRP